MTDYYSQQRIAVEVAQQDISDAIAAFTATLSPLVAALNSANDDLTSAARATGQPCGRLGALPPGAPTAYNLFVGAYIALANPDPARNGGLTPLGPTA